MSQDVHDQRDRAVIIIAPLQRIGETWFKLKLRNYSRRPVVISTPAGLAGVKGRLVVDLAGVGDCPHWLPYLLNNLVIQDV